MGERHDYSSSFYNLNLKQKIKLETISYLGKLLFSKKINTTKKYLQLGCGVDDINDKFYNCDFFTSESINPFKKN